MSTTLNSYCHDFRSLMEAILALSQVAGYVSEFNEYRDRRVYATDDASILFHYEGKEAAWVFKDQSGLENDLSIKVSGCVPMVKVMKGFLEVFYDRKEVFHTLMENREVIIKAVQKITLELMREHESTCMKILERGLSAYKQVVDKYMVDQSQRFTSLLIWYVTRPDVAARYQLGLGEVYLLTTFTKRPQTRYYRESQFYLYRGEGGVYSFFLRHETLQIKQDAILYKHLTPEFWGEQEIATDVLMKKLLK